MMVTSYDICFLLGLPCVTQLGQYMPDLMNTYGASLSVMIIAVAEMVAVMWGYGVNNFCRDIKHMLGFIPGWYFKVWCEDSWIAQQFLKVIFPDLLGPDLITILGSYLHSSLLRVAVTVIRLSPLPSMGSHHRLGTDTVVSRAEYRSWSTFHPETEHFMLSRRRLEALLLQHALFLSVIFWEMSCNKTEDSSHQEGPCRYRGLVR